MAEKFRLDRTIGFQNTFYTKCINVIIDSIGPSIILRSIVIPCMSACTWDSPLAKARGLSLRTGEKPWFNYYIEYGFKKKKMKVCT